MVRLFRLPSPFKDLPKQNQFLLLENLIGITRISLKRNSIKVLKFVKQVLGFVGIFPRKKWLPQVMKISSSRSSPE